MIVDIDVRPATSADLPALLDLMNTVEMAESGSADWTVELLQEEWSEPRLDLTRDSFVAWEGDLPVAYSLVLDRHGSGHMQSDHYVRPGEEHWPAGRVVLDRIAARCAEIAKETGREEVIVTLGQMVDAPFAASVLPQQSWRVARKFARMARSLSDVDAVDVPLPDGVTVRTVRTEADRRSYHQIATDSFSDHWGSEAESYDDFMRRVATWETNDWSLWWIAAADGEDVGCLRTRPWADGAGFIDTLGVLKAARGRGVGSTLLRVAFAEFARRGYRRAELMVDTDNVTGALRVYEAARMALTWQADIWELKVSSIDPAAWPSH